MLEPFAYDRKRAGIILQTKRLRENYTQEKLAEVAGCSPRTIVDIEGGKVGMSIEMLLTLCSLLKTTPDEVLLGEGNGSVEWLVEEMRALTPEQRKVAIDIISPYIQSVLRSDAK